MTEGKNRSMIYGPKEVITQGGSFLLRQAGTTVLCLKL
jgi:hypothetical protein